MGGSDELFWHLYDCFCTLLHYSAKGLLCYKTNKETSRSDLLTAFYIMTAQPLAATFKRNTLYFLLCCLCLQKGLCFFFYILSVIKGR